MFFKKTKDELTELEIKFQQSEKRLLNAVKALAPRHKGGEPEEFEAARTENLMLQRAVSLAKGEETAISLEWKYPWNTGAPLPHIVSSGYKTFLIYYISEPDPNWDGTNVTVIDSTSEQMLPLALVEFIGCYSMKFGGANDEVLSGHPLWKKGLEPYQAHEIKNSRWLNEEMKINSVHPYYNEKRWNNRKHFMLLFHDEMFECIAEDYTTEILNDTFEGALIEAQKRMMNR